MDLNFKVVQNLFASMVEDGLAPYQNVLKVRVFIIACVLFVYCIMVVSGVFLKYAKFVIPLLHNAHTHLHTVDIYSIKLYLIIASISFHSSIA